MSLCALLFLNTSNAVTTNDSLKQDRGTAYVIVANNIAKTIEYRDLLERIDKLEQEKTTQLHKKDAAKVLGYTSGTLGVITSIWSIYEKSLSLGNSKVELEIRKNIKSRVLADIEALKLSEHTTENATALAKKLESLAEVEEKLANIHTRMRISRMGLYRGIFKFSTSIGLFVATIFMDEISKYVYDKTVSKKQQYSQFLNNWNIIVYEANILHNIDMYNIDARVLLYFVQYDTDWNEALLDYKKQNPEGYNKF